jgi:integrase
MPRVKLTKTVIDALPTPSKETVYWDTGSPGFGVKITPKGRKVFLVMYRTAGAGSRLCKYTIGPYGRVTLIQARVTAQKVFAAKLEGRDLAAEKRDSRKKMVADRVDDLLEAFIAQHVAQNRSAREISRILRREVKPAWGSRSIHELTKRDVIDLVSAIEQRGAPAAANKALKTVKTFFRWSVGRALLDRSPADGVPLPAKQVARDRVLSDYELAKVILAARQIGGPYGNIVEVLALTGQRREEVARCTWGEIDLKAASWKLTSDRTKNAKSHEVHLSGPVIAVLSRANRQGKFIFFGIGR